MDFFFSYIFQETVKTRGEQKLLDDVQDLIFVVVVRMDVIGFIFDIKNNWLNI